MHGQGFRFSRSTGCGFECGGGALHQIDREFDGWPAYQVEIVCKNIFLQAVRREPCGSVPSWWRPGCINECVVEVPVPLLREETEELTNRDQLLDVPVASTGVKSVDDGEAWPPEFAKYSATTFAEVVRRLNPRVACRRVNACRRLSPSVACRRLDDGRSLSLRVECRRLDAGRRLSQRVARGRGSAGRRLSRRVTCRQ